MKPFSTGLLFLCLTSWIFGQGAITPSGPPGPTMKSAQEIYDAAELAQDPRTIITGVTAPEYQPVITISESGSYILGQNLMPHESGINITASNVTLDLNGFTLQGLGAGYGIQATGSNIRIRNGSITGFYQSLFLNDIHNSTIEDLQISNPLDNAVQVNGGTHLKLQACAIQSPGNVGIYVTGNAVGFQILNCQILGGDIGIHIVKQTTNNQGHQIKGNQITDAVQVGISIEYAQHCLIQNNFITGNTFRGIDDIYGSSIITNNILSGDMSASLWIYNLDTVKTTYGPIIVQDGAIPTTGSGASPWANIYKSIEQ